MNSRPLDRLPRKTQCLIRYINGESAEVLSQSFGVSLQRISQLNHSALIDLGVYRKRARDLPIEMIALLVRAKYGPVDRRKLDVDTPEGFLYFEIDYKCAGRDPVNSRSF